MPTRVLIGSFTRSSITCFPFPRTPILILRKVHLHRHCRWKHHNYRRMAFPKVIIDTDAGTDDAMAILMALAAHKRGEIDIIAITTVQGNTGVDNVNSNVLRTLKTADMLQIPVYSGASRSLVHPWKHDDKPFHGKDGFGDATHSEPAPPKSLLQPQHAAWALTDLANKYAGEIIVAALGPLTNLALAIRLDPHFTSRLRNIYVMGGNTTGEGNYTTSAEFNFVCDPEAARVVLEETERAIHLTPWEICLYGVTLPYEMRRKMGSINTPQAELLNKIEARSIARGRFENWITCDQLAVAWMIDNIRRKTSSDGTSSQTVNGTETQLITATKQCFATVEVNGSLTRGQMVIDHQGMWKRTPNLIIMTRINQKLYERYLVTGFGGKFESEVL